MCCTDAVCSPFIIWHQITHLVFLAISDEANTDRDLWMHPTVGKVLTSVHQSLFTCFIRQGRVKTNFDISLFWKRLDSRAALLIFLFTQSQRWYKKYLVCACGCTLYLCNERVFKLRVGRTDACIPASMLLHAHICIFLSVVVSVSRAELRWATACCSAVTMPALVCIIYPPADWSREKA